MNNSEKLIISTEKIITFLILLIMGYVGYRMIKTQPKDAIITNTENCKKQKEIQFSGVVIENQWSRGSFISVFKNKTVFKWRCKSKVRDIIEVGDSIYKPAGTFNTYIYKKANPDSVIFIECDFDCDYWKKRYGNKK